MITLLHPRQSLSLTPISLQDYNYKKQDPSCSNQQQTNLIIRQMAYGSPGRSSSSSPVVTIAPTTISSRAEQIERSRIELLGLLHDVPEAQFELSLTDLVEKKTTPSPTNAGSEVKEESQPLCTTQKRSEKAKIVNQSLARKSRSTGTDGVLLNVFLPKSIGRSSTWSYPRRLGSDERHRKVAVGQSTNTKENHLFVMGCLPTLWSTAKPKTRKKS